ncbi:dihydroorotate dehydrogenase electron transfer subunit [Intrasporangium sp.]|uniref:iron-sulfur cluster-binding protein n=1 Tax=Intrasporangium sp. TaxID=1925024 RepID=UPI00293A8239|nr:dihydroorotate dehydrogenase electron transfer subunit [Intrasporangium sp.]MDV3221547.1 dihydroorotate dehydrogenase electron transfer subunit [Intrasporangium sp.]
MTGSGDDATRVVRRSRVTQERGEVIATRRAGAYQHLTLVAPGIAGHAAPGQLVAVAVGEGDQAPALRRLVLIHEVTPSGTYGGTVELVVHPRDAATAWLASRRPHDGVDVVGPVGRGFPLPVDSLPCVLVAEGRGSGPLLWLARILRARGCRVEMVLGAPSEDRLLGVIEARRRCDAAIVTTADGSAGQRGHLVDVLPEVLDRTGAAVVYACGSLPVLRATAAAAAERGVVSQLAIEGPPGCGIGVCLGCVVPITGTDDQTRLVRTCVEGPVLRGDRLRWDAFVDGHWRTPRDAVAVGSGPVGG